MEILALLVLAPFIAAFVQYLTNKAYERDLKRRREKLRRDILEADAGSFTYVDANTGEVSAYTKRGYPLEGG